MSTPSTEQHAPSRATEDALAIAALLGSIAAACWMARR